MTKKMKELLAVVRENPGLNTHQISLVRGDRQSYESNLRDRLLRLCERGHVRAVECVKSSTVIERRFYPC